MNKRDIPVHPNFLRATVTAAQIRLKTPNSDGLFVANLAGPFRVLTASADKRYSDIRILFNNILQNGAKHQEFEGSVEAEEDKGEAGPWTATKGI